MAKRDNLTRYWQKRDFSKTPEPKGTTQKKTGQRYLIQKHAASRLHYDFRLELDGVLKSWAVTRGPSLDPHDKRLAVEVEDHPVSYGDFEGIIPKGQYGGGTVMLWDEGSWEPVGDPNKALKNGKLVFKLYGKRLTGEWTLVRMRTREKDRGRHNWLLIKHRDETAKEGDKDALLSENITSVASGRSMEKIAASQDRVWKSKNKKTTYGNDNKKLPAFIPPQLATLTDAMPQGKEWVHEIKFDGYRGLAYLANGQCRIHTRTGLDWTNKFEHIADALKKLPVSDAILDGEIVALNENNVSSFIALKSALSQKKSAGLQYYVFDLLYLDGKDLRALSLLERKKILEKILVRPSIKNTIFYSEHFAARSDAMLKRVCNLEMEGIISKRADAPYASGRGTSWLKTKCHKRQEFVIGGFTLPTHAARGIGALLLGYYEEERLIYAGRVGTGFNHATSLALRKQLDRIALKAPAFEKIGTEGKRGAHWVKPKMVCEVEFTEWTPDGHLRHPSFQGLREDKPAISVRRDRAMKRNSNITNKSTIETRRENIASVTISNPQRIIYPGTDITKLQLAQYYEAVADHILPHVVKRPLSMVRCPEGTGDACFFQRHLAHDIQHIYSAGIKVKGRNEDYIMIKDEMGLITLAQWGVIELHPWGCLADKPSLPDRIIFDLDPDPDMPWAHVIEGAKEVRDRMRELGLESFIKTTGGKGLHVGVPMVRHYPWPTIKAFARAVAESMQQDNPKRYIAKASKAARKGRIFIDYLRNDLTSTSVSAFSARAREGATVSMPIAWEEVKTVLNPKRFTIDTVPTLLRKTKKNPWEDFFKVKQKIAATYLRALKIPLE